MLRSFFVSNFVPKNKGFVEPREEEIILPSFNSFYFSKDYSHEILVATEREKYLVPIKAIGARAILDFPDDITFPLTAVKSSNASKVLFVRNVGNREARFVLQINKFVEYFSRLFFFMLTLNIRFIYSDHFKSDRKTVFYLLVKVCKYLSTFIQCRMVKVKKN